MQTSRKATDNLFLAKLSIDSKGRLFLPKEARSILDLRPYDEIVISREGAGFLVSIQRDDRVVCTWELTATKLEQAHYASST